MGVSEMVVPPNHPFLIGISILNHPFWGTTIFGNIHIFQMDGSITVEQPRRLSIWSRSLVEHYGSLTRAYRAITPPNC